MLKLIKCELMKLKRKKFIPLVFLSAFLFPVPITFLMATPRMLERYPNKTVLFDGLFNMVMGYGVIFLLPCVIGVIAAMLFFMERDNDTFKNLRTIPVTSTQMIMAKIIVLFIFGVIFCLASMFATVICGSFSMEIHGLAYKLLVAIELGIFITAGTLPVVVLVVFFSRTYIFSILLCVFYSVASLTVETLFGTLPKWLASADPSNNALGCGRYGKTWVPIKRSSFGKNYSVNLSDGFHFGNNGCYINLFDRFLI